MFQIPRFLTLDSLYRFFEDRGQNFSCKKSDNMQFAVMVPGEFEVQKDTMKGLLKARVKVCHTEMNRNHSYISEDNMLAALPTLKYRPVLAYIHQLDDGTYDFYAHNYNVVQKEDGENQYEYLEKQVGCFMDYEPELEYDESNGKNYVIGYAAIPEEYTEAANIIRRKQGTKVSAELIIDEMNYNAKEKCLELVDFYFGGVTLLGCDEEGTPIEEGMLGSRLDIADDKFVQKSFELNAKLIEALERVELALDGFDIAESKKGGQDNMEENQVEIVENEEVLAEEEPQVETETPAEEVAQETEMEIEEEPAKEEFADLSQEEIRSALYKLVRTYEEADNDYYDIVATYDDAFIIRGWLTDKLFKCGYAVEDGHVALVGEREEVFQIIVTADEKAKLDEMRENYAALKQFKADYDAAQLKAEKDAVFARDCYDEIRNSESFGKLISDACQFTVEELEMKCDLLYAAHMKTQKYSAKEDSVESKDTVSFNFTQPSEKKVYAGLF